MTKKSRYFLIILGFVVFLILAPLIVFYVRGLTYNFKTHSFSQTGILSTVVDPGDAEIYLNGKPARSGSGDIKFLTPGEYGVTLKAPGYSGWTKRLLVAAGQVTWANPSYGKIYLFFQNPKSQNLASNVSDFYSQGNNLVYLQNNTAVVSTLSNPGTVENYPLPKNADTIMAYDDSGKNFIFTSSVPGAPTVLFFNSDSGQIIDLSGLFTQAPQMQFSGSDLYALTAGNLYKIDIADKKKLLAFSNVNAFYFQNSDLYFLQTQGGDTKLVLNQGPYNGNQVLMDSLPPLPKPQIFVTFGKQIFVLSGGNLYLANLGMQELAQGVSSFNFNSGNPSVPIVQSGELDYYDTLAQNTDFVTRSSQQLNNPLVENSIGYAFYSVGGQIYALELDPRDNQNTYVLYSGQSVQKFSIDNTDKNILLLDNGLLNLVTVR